MSVLAPWESIGSSEYRKVPLEPAETLPDGPQCLILSRQHDIVGSVSGRLQRQGNTPESPTPAGLFFHDLQDAGGEQVLDSSEL